MIGMKLLVSALCFLVTSMAMAEDEDFLQALRSYQTVEPATPGDLKLVLADGLLKEWADLDEANRYRLSHKVFTVHFFKAQLLASTGKPKEAAQELVAELKLQSDHDGRLEYSTKSPDLFFESLVELQARLTAENGADPLAGAVDYVFGTEGQGFMAARFEPWDQIKLSTMPVAEGEKLAVVHRITKKNGSFEVSSTKWLVVPEGKLRDVMKKARREITSDEDGELVTRELK
jgi:hypothetical protein